jgi:GntR family transcriptional regulator/MocR family aminotransferase
MPQDWLPFQPGLPDQALFPHRHWAKCLDQAWRAPDQALLARPDHFGWFPLRQVISDHLSAWRGLDSGPHQILITSGAWEGFEIICEALLPSDRPVAMEDPGWSPLRQILKRSQKPPHPIRVDDHGLNVGLIPPKAQAVVVTPSRHFPTGQSMPLARRAALLNWADTHRGLIVEDDYDSEFRYQGQPLPSLSGLDGLQNTVYLGSFSKLLSPVLRLGYLVIPERFIPKVQAYIMARGAQASLVPQPALAMFMENGTFATHLRRMRRVYAKRQRVLLTALADVADLIDLQPDPSGMHLCCPLKPALTQVVTDAEISKAAQDHNLMVRALSSHSVLAKPPQGLLLGYAAFDTDMLTAAARTLADVLRTYRPFASPTF